MKFNEAKIALKRSKSVEDVRQAREKIQNLGEEHHLPFEFPVASELLEAYLARKALPFKKQESARTYLSADGKINHDAYAIGEVHNPTYVFGISPGNKYSTTRGLDAPSFENVVADAPIQQLSITNIIKVKDTGLVVFKAFLDRSLSTMARNNIPRAAAESSERRAESETTQLGVLRDMFKNSADIYVPRVLGRTHSVIAMTCIMTIST